MTGVTFFAVMAAGIILTIPVWLGAAEGGEQGEAAGHGAHAVTFLFVAVMLILNHTSQLCCGVKAHGIIKECQNMSLNVTTKTSCSIT